MKSDMIQRIGAFEMWIWRRMEKVSWTEKNDNEEELTMVYQKRRLMGRIINTKKR